MRVVPEKHRGIPWTKELIESVKNILVKKIGYNRDKKIFNRKECESIYILEFSNQDILNLYHWFKENGTQLMKRKNDIIENYLESKPHLKREVS